MRFVLIACILGSMFLFSCLDKEDFSYIPKIEYKEMYQQDSSIIIKISFTDGDGDIGLRENEEGAYAPCTDYHYNLFVDPYIKVDDQFVERYFLDRDSKCFPKPAPDTGYYPDTVGYYYRTAYLVPEGKDKNLEGDIYITLNDALITFRDDTIKFNIKLIDRAHNESNIVETEVIIP